MNDRVLSDVTRVNMCHVPVDLLMILIVICANTQQQHSTGLDVCVLFILRRVIVCGVDKTLEDSWDDNPAPGNCEPFDKPLGLMHLLSNDKGIFLCFSLQW